MESRIDIGTNRLVSAGQRFELGFFNTVGTRGGIYVGIWHYNVIPHIVVWIANRISSLLSLLEFLGSQRMVTSK